MAIERDYYQILGVDPGANLDAIRKAYRRLAFECHPDRGGSHERMVIVIEAWEILSDPESRRRYDESRKMAGSPGLQQAAGADANQARQRAEQYPRQWAAFEAWSNKVAGDFARAEYGSEPLNNPFLKLSMPTVEKSISGALFLVGGALLGGLLLSPMIYNFIDKHMIDPQKNVRWDIIKMVFVGSPVLGGAWAGAMLHQWIRNAIRMASKQADCQSQTQPGRAGNHEEKQEAKSASDADAIIIACEKCGQKLRVPRIVSELLVTCGSCQHKFSCRPNDN